MVQVSGFYCTWTPKVSDLIDGRSLFSSFLQFVCVLLGSRQ